MTQQPKGRGTVVTYSCRASRHHESVTLRELASRLAAIKDCDFGDEYDPVRRYSAPLYFVPNDTLVGIEAAQGLGINGEHDLFGGVVPFAFAATKMITHPLLMPSRSRRKDGLRHSPIAFATLCCRATRRLPGAMPGSPGCDYSSWGAFASSFPHG